jgi:hypothetical protein
MTIVSMFHVSSGPLVRSPTAFKSHTKCSSRDDAEERSHVDRVDRSTGSNRENQKRHCQYHCCTTTVVILCATATSERLSLLIY